MAWLFNLRGNDVPYNPVFVSYAIITDDSATLYVNPAKVKPEVEAHLQAAGVVVKAYEDIVGDVVALAKSNTAMLMDPSKVMIVGGGGDCGVWLWGDCGVW